MDTTERRRRAAGGPRQQQRHEDDELLDAAIDRLVGRGSAIDEALLHTADDVGEPSVRRILIDDPYANAKASVISAVGTANRCRLVHSPAAGRAAAGLASLDVSLHRLPDA
jgi:hypothetical protein